MKNLIAHKPFRGTWKGAVGTLHLFTVGRNRFGKRVSVLQWDDGSLSVKVLKGDARQKGATIHEEIDIPAGNHDLPAIAENLATKHFG